MAATPHPLTTVRTALADALAFLGASAESMAASGTPMDDAKLAALTGGLTAAVAVVDGMTTPTLPDLPDASAWMTNESAARLDAGGNCKGAVPVHRRKSSTARNPLFSAYKMHEFYAQGRADERAALSAAPAAVPVAFDAEGFRAWVLRELPDDTIIGKGAWWADHLTKHVQWFVKPALAAPDAQQAAEPQRFRTPTRMTP